MRSRRASFTHDQRKQFAPLAFWDWQKLDFEIASTHDMGR
jgi:hypothetical protein